MIKVRPNHKKNRSKELRSVEREEERNHQSFQEMIRLQKEKVRMMEELKNGVEAESKRSDKKGNDWICEV